MSCLIFCTFDLRNAGSEDYKNAYADLEKIGLSKVQKNADGSHAVIPTTAAMGFFTGTNAGTVCAELRNKVAAAFAARKFKSEIFIVAGRDWAWITGVT